VTEPDAGHKPGRILADVEHVDIGDVEALSRLVHERLVEDGGMGGKGRYDCVLGVGRVTTGGECEAGAKQPCSNLKRT